MAALFYFFASPPPLRLSDSHIFPFSWKFGKQLRTLTFLLPIVLRWGGGAAKCEARSP